MSTLRTPVLLTSCLLALTTTSALAQDYGLTIGKKEVIDSKILKEQRTILVSAPQQPKPGMPLLVVLDGEWNFRKVTAAVDNLSGNSRLPPMVVVGVVNKDRGRDLTPTFAGTAFADGPSDRFLAFLADELIPHIKAEYPIGNYRILAGHSNAGMFALYAFVRRPEVFQANIALSPSYGLDDRFVARLADALANSAAGPHFVFIGNGGDEEADISVGAMRFAKTFEAAPNPDIEYHYEIFPGETHGSVGFRAFYRALELLGEADAPAHSGPGRYLSEAQRRRHAWTRRFGSAFDTQPLPLLSVARPMLDALGSSNPNDAPATWERLRTEFAGDFRIDPVERQNLLAALDAQGRKDDADRLRQIPGFAAAGAAQNSFEIQSYGTELNLDTGLVAYLPLQGSPGDLCHPEAKPVVHGAVPAPDRHGRPNMAYRFSGKGDSIEIPRNPDYDTAGSISVSAWVRPHVPVAYSAWVSQVGPRWGSQWRLGFGPTPEAQWGATIFGTRWTDYWVDAGGLPVDRWVHTAAVFDQTLGELHVYVNGREVQTFHGLSPWGSSPGPLLVGAQRDDGIFFNGDVGEVRVYRRVLNANEVKALAEDSGAQPGTCSPMEKNPGQGAH
jgi:predicted alpha/beta superfamily hydrolase